jgi:hypothetical protein
VTEPAPEPPRVDWEPLDLPENEPRPKRVVQDAEFLVAINLNDRQEREYVRIRGLIRTGGDLRPFYRKSSMADRLLKNEKVLHLHLGGPDSDAILYVIQYPAHVLFVRVDTHIHLEDVPAGKASAGAGQAGLPRRRAARTGRQGKPVGGSDGTIEGR